MYIKDKNYVNQYVVKNIDEVNQPKGDSKTNT